MVKPDDDDSTHHTENLGTWGTLRIGRPTLYVAAGSAAGQVIPIVAARFVIGSGSGLDLTLKERGVSRKHALIEAVGDRLLLKDLGSTNGTLVNGVPIREVFLTPGDLITIGEAKLRFEPRQEEIAVPPSVRDRFGPLFGGSLPMRQLFGYLERVSASDSTVLIQGETGTGKELVARALHESGRRKNKPFIAFDCSLVSPELVGSELFGHREGAFTGASRNRQGAFEAAAGGTLFLDEIGELPLELQPVLLRALETREVRPIGSNQSVPVDIRVLAATHRDVKGWVARGRFREDLYYRLAVLHVLVPPLRERREDIEGLARNLLAKLVPDRKIVLTPDAIASLATYSWPGNVRELRNVIERSTALLAGDTLAAKDLFIPSDNAVSRPPGGNRPLEDVERDTVMEMLAAVDGNKKEAARRLGIHRSTLYAKLKKWGVPDDDPEP